MAAGTVKFYDDQKGYGFISPDDGGSEIFIHIGDARRGGIDPPIKGERLEFELVTDPRSGRLRAGNVRREQ